MWFGLPTSTAFEARPPQEAFDRPGAFCESTIRHGMAERLFNMSEAELQSRLARGQVPHLGRTSPWIGLQYPDIQVRKAFFNSHVGDGTFVETDEIQQTFKIASIDTADNLFPKGAPCKDTSCSLYNLKWFLERGSEMTPTPEKTLLPAAILCQWVAPLVISQCVLSMQHQVKISQGWLDIVLIPTAIEWMVNDLNRHPKALPYAMVLLANKTFWRIENETSTGTLFEDIQQSLKEAGIPEKEVVDLAWRTIAVAAMSGANTAHFLRKASTPASMTMLLGLHIATKGMEVINTWSIARNGRVFSLPASVTGACNNAKFYHFWMAAYLARSSVQQGFRPEIAAKTAFLLHVGYQFNAPKGSGRDLAQAFFTGTFGNANLRARIDFSVASTGAKFGATSAAGSRFQWNEPLDTDRTFTHLLRQANDLPLLTESKARRMYQKQKLRSFARWNRIVTPMEAFRVRE